MARPKPNIKTIRASSHPLGTGDFTTIQAWEDWADDRSNPCQWAECYEGFNLGTFTLSGWSSTPTPSGYPRIYAASGEQHMGNVTRGPVIAMPSGVGSVNTIGVNYAQVEGLGSTRGFHMDLDTSSNMLIENCWATSEGNVCFKAKTQTTSTASSGNVIRNCLAIGTNTQDEGFVVGGADMMGGLPQIKIHNCTAYGLKNTGIKVFNTKLPGFWGGANTEIKNCLSVDCNGADYAIIDGGNGSLDRERNLSSDLTAPTHGSFLEYLNIPTLILRSSTVDDSTSKDILHQPVVTRKYYPLASIVVSAEHTFVNPSRNVEVKSLVGGGVKILASGDFHLKKPRYSSNNPPINAPVDNEANWCVDNGAYLDSVKTDIRGARRTYMSAGGVQQIQDYTLNEPFSLNGYFPLYSTPEAANHASSLLGVSGSGAHHTHTFTGETFPNSSGVFFMPNGLMMEQNQFHSTFGNFIEGYTAFPYTSSYDIGAFQYYRQEKYLPLAIQGPLPNNSGIPLYVASVTPASGITPLFLFTGQVSSLLEKKNLNIGNFTFKRREPLFIRNSLSPIGGVDKFALNRADAAPSSVLLTDSTQLSIDGRPFSTNPKMSASPREYRFEPDLSTNSKFFTSRVGGSGLYKKESDFKVDNESDNIGQTPLHILGYSGITGPNSYLESRNRLVNSQGFFPGQRVSTFFAESENNCGDGSLYKFDNNVNDNSSDYQFRLYPSGWHQNVTNVGQIVESGFYQTSTRFPSSSAVGSGTGRFIGGVDAGIKMISNSTYYGTVLMQSGSPSIHDHHRIPPKEGYTNASGVFSPSRRGVSTSFWINKKRALNTNPGLKAIQGVMGNLLLNNGTAAAASGQWGIYYIPTTVNPSGTTPFNSLKDTFSIDKEGKFKADSKALGGLVPFVNTTAGGNMGRLLRTNSQGELIQEHVPDTMMPLDEDRWYYINFWIDTELKKSFIRVAAPSKGTPGQSGYYSEIKPITETCQKWKNYEVKTDADNIKFKVGGDLWRNQTLPYFNLGYGLGNGQEEFVIDELNVSNKVCSKLAMETKFDSDYIGYTVQFSKRTELPLFIIGQSGV